MQEINFENTDQYQAQARDIDPEEFFNNPHAIYVRLEYFPDTDQFKFLVKNTLLETYYKKQGIVPKSIMALTRYIKGMVQVALHNPEQISQVGLRLDQEEFIDQCENLSPEMKRLMKAMPKGIA